MLRTIDLRGVVLDTPTLAGALPRATVGAGDALAAAQALIDDVRARGEAALREQAERFDGGAPDAFRVPAERLAAALAALPSVQRSALEAAIGRVRQASAAQVPPEVVTEPAGGARIRQRWLPVRRVGLYVPGGKAVYPSSVVMNVVPAQAAGVGAVVLATPAQRAQGGGADPVVLAAAALLGVDEVYVMGGAGAIGALAYGVPGIGLDRVDVITGPGNVFVAAAKRAVAGVVGIDAEAGPTEILIVADVSADPALIAADLVSQAEHDELAAAVLVTDDPGLARAVDDLLPSVVARTKHAARVRTALGGRQSAIVLVDDLTAAAAVSNAYAPEHLEVQVADPAPLVELLTEAGAVFVGPTSPVSLGDYLAGSNHVLPTGGTARFSAGLNASVFLRAQQVVEYDRAALAVVRPHIRVLADAEDLPAHGDAVDARFD